MRRLNGRRRSRCAQRGFTWIDLLVVLCLIPVFAAGCFYSTCRSRETANRVKCASNLRQIGQAILLYSNDNKGARPRTRVSAGPDRAPVWGTGAPATQPFADDGPAENDVTAGLFLLLRTQDITAEVFNCPSSNTAKDFYGGGTNSARQRSNFTEVKKNLSYSYHNPYPSQSALESTNLRFACDSGGAEFAIAADINPGTTPAGSDEVTKPTSSGSAKEMKLGNSSNHDKDGQNILYADGHVSWESNPFVGVNRDNIYTSADGRVIASPVDTNDSVLLPTDD